MKPESQRIAIAEACGWKHEPDKYYEDRLAWFDPTTNRRCSTCDLPDYLNDLNAMHEAEKVLDGLDRFPNPRLVYYDNLREVCRSPEPTNCWSATHAQRAEAFLRTIGKWEDDK